MARTIQWWGAVSIGLALFAGTAVGEDVDLHRGLSDLSEAADAYAEALGDSAGIDDPKIREALDAKAEISRRALGRAWSALEEAWHDSRTELGRLQADGRRLGRDIEKARERLNARKAELTQTYARLPGGPTEPERVRAKDTLRALEQYVYAVDGIEKRLREARSFYGQDRLEAARRSLTQASNSLAQLYSAAGMPPDRGPDPEAAELRANMEKTLSSAQRLRGLGAADEATLIERLMQKVGGGDAPVAPSGDSEVVVNLRREVASLRSQIAALQQQVAQLHAELERARQR